MLHLRAITGSFGGQSSSTSTNSRGILNKQNYQVLYNLFYSRTLKDAGISHTAPCVLLQSGRDWFDGDEYILNMCCLSFDDNWPTLRQVMDDKCQPRCRHPGLPGEGS
ncbi:hypothetical protein XPA_001327 [Xanthoria parietina]